MALSGKNQNVSSVLYTRMDTRGSDDAREWRTWSVQRDQAVTKENVANKRESLEFAMTLNVGRAVTKKKVDIGSPVNY